LGLSVPKHFGWQPNSGFLPLCVIALALYGALTVKKSILVVQGLPALLALGSLFLM